MRYFASAEEMSAALSLPILLRVDVDSRFLERHDRLSGYAADRPHAGRVFHRALAQFGAKGWNGKTVWVAGPWGSLEHLPWAVGFAQVAADEGARAFLFAPGIDLPLIERGGVGEQLWSEMSARLAPLGGEALVAFSTDLAGVRVLAPGSGNRAGAMGEACLVFAESLPESLTGPYRGPAGIDAVILVAGFRDHGVYELETVARGLVDAGHRVLGIVAVGPAAAEDPSQSRSPEGSSQAAALAARSPGAAAGAGEGLLGATRARPTEPTERRGDAPGGDVWGRRPGRGSGQGATPVDPPNAPPNAPPGARTANPAPEPKPLESGSLLSQAQAKQELAPAPDSRQADVTSARVDPVPARPESVRPPESPSFVAGQEAAARARAEEARRREERDAEERAEREAARETAARIEAEKVAAAKRAAEAQAAERRAAEQRTAEKRAEEKRAAETRESERTRAARSQQSSKGPKSPDGSAAAPSAGARVVTPAVAESRPSRREEAEHRREAARAQTAAGKAAGAVPLLARWEAEAARDRRVQRVATAAALLVLATLVVLIGLPVAKRKGWVPAGTGDGASTAESTAVGGARPAIGDPANGRTDSALSTAPARPDSASNASPRSIGVAGLGGAADSGRGVPRAAGLEEEESSSGESTRVARPNPAVPRDFPWGEPKRAGVATDSARAPLPEHRAALSESPTGETNPPRSSDPRSSDPRSGDSRSGDSGTGASGSVRPAPPGRASAAEGAGPNAAGEHPPGDYVVHLSSFRLEREAQSEVQSLAGQGIKAEYLLVDVPDRGPWYRVVTGRFATFGEAETMAMRLCRMKGVPRTHVVGQGGRGDPVPVDSLAGVPAAARPRMD